MGIPKCQNELQQKKKMLCHKAYLPMMLIFDTIHCLLSGTLIFPYVKCSGQLLIEFFSISESMKNNNINLIESHEYIFSLNQQHFGDKIIAPGNNEGIPIKTSHKLFWLELVLGGTVCSQNSVYGSPNLTLSTSKYSFIWKQGCRRSNYDEVIPEYSGLTHMTSVFRKRGNLEPHTGRMLCKHWSYVSTRPGMNRSQKRFQEKMLPYCIQREHSSADTAVSSFLPPD